MRNEDYKKNSSHNGIPYDQLSPEWKRYIDGKAKEFKEVMGDDAGWQQYPQENESSASSLVRWVVLGIVAYLLFKGCT